MTKERYGELRQRYEDTKPGIYDQPGIKAYQALMAAQTEAHGATTESGAAEAPDEAPDHVTAYRQSAIDVHEAWQAALISYLAHALAKLECDAVTPETAIDKIRTTMREVEPIAKALRALHPSHETSTAASGHLSRSNCPTPLG